MTLVNLDNQQLDAFVATQSGAFLQSGAWADFNTELGAKVWRWGVVDKGEIVATAMVIEKSLSLGFKYWYCPRGPIVNYQLSIINFQLIFNFLMTELEKRAKQEKIIFFRFEPTKEFNIQNSIRQLADKIQKSLPIQPQQTIILNLAKSEEELLSAMHPKTRYNIKLAGKKNLVVKHGQPSETEFAKFWELMEATKVRDNFNLHSPAYYRAMLKSPLMELWQVYFKDQLLAVAIIAKFGDTVTYVHGASSNEWRPLMAPYYLHWQIIQTAKQEGFKHYDLFGVDRVKWPGVTRFKEGWAGANISYPGTFDLVFNRLYYGIYQGLRKIRRKF